MGKRMKSGRMPERPWEPLQRAVLLPMTSERRTVLEEQGLVEQFDAVRSKTLEVWKNHLYTVIVERRPDDDSVTCLSIRRNDRRAIRDWRHFQRIKNEIAGPEVEAVELFPAQSRVVDTANQYWLWCFRPGAVVPVGFEEGVLSGPEDAVVVGAKQRPLPDDWA